MANGVLRNVKKQFIDEHAEERFEFLTLRYQTRV